MDQNLIFDVTRQALWIAVRMSAPLLAVALAGQAMAMAAAMAAAVPAAVPAMALVDLRVPAFSVTVS